MDKEQEAEAINTAIKSTGDLPRIGNTPTGEVTLLMGYQDIDGAWHKNAYVRELTGEDEEALASLENRTGISYAEYMSALLTRAVVSIGPYDLKSAPHLVDELVVPDRDLLFIGIIRATYGDHRKFTLKCKCGGDNDVNVDLVDAFPVLGTTEEIRKVRSVTLRDGTVIKLKQPNGTDSKFIAKYAKNSAEQNTALISRCALVEYPDTLSWAKKLGIADRNALVKALLDQKFGPQVEEVNAPCGYCGEEISLAVDWVSLLFG
jgi:hypothetical protein